MVERVSFPEFEITSVARIPFKELRTRIFSLKYNHKPLTEEQLVELALLEEEARIANKSW